MIFDTHCHLNSEELYPNIDKHIKEAKEKGVDTFLVVGWDKESSLLAVEIAYKYDCCYAAVGFHPCNINDVSEEDYNEVISKLSLDKVVALGEIGLDYHWVEDENERNKQKEYFKKQIHTANKYNKPIIIHDRDAHQDCLNILKANPVNKGGVMHCYSASKEMVNEFLKQNMYISLGGPVTFTNSKSPKEVASIVPLDKLLIETDCPYLTPHPFRGKENAPKYIELVLEKIYWLRSGEKNEIESAIYENSFRCFGIKR